MAKFKKIIIHVGPPKTGSSFIQSQLQHAAEALSAAGWSVPSRLLTHADGLSTLNHSVLFRAVVNKKGELFQEDLIESLNVAQRFRDWLEECNTPGLLLSGEGGASHTEAEWRKFKAFLQEFVADEADIRFVYFVRDPLQKFVSGRNERMKHGFEFAAPHGKPNQNALDPFKRMVAVWGEDARYEAHSYEQAKEEGLWPYVLKLMDLKPNQFPAHPNTSEVNASVSLESRWILNECDRKSIQEERWMAKAHEIPGTRDGLTADEAKAVWTQQAVPLNTWLSSLSMPEYAFDPPLVNLNAKDLWPEACVAGWQRLHEEASPDERAFFAEAFEKFGSSELMSSLHPEARKRFERLKALFHGQTQAKALTPNQRKSRQRKWRSAAGLMRSVVEDAVRGHRRWPATRGQLDRLVADWDRQRPAGQQFAAAPPLAAAPQKEHAKPQPKKRFQEEDFSIPARGNWHADPFSAEHFPALKVLSFHIPKTGGSAFFKCMEASSLEPVCFLSHLGFATVFEALQALPKADRGLAFANAIASALPREAMAIQGHILFNPMLQPFLMNRSDVMKVTWVREPVAQVHSRYAFVRQVLLSQAPAGWGRPEFADTIFLDVMASCTHPNVKDPQSKCLKGLSLEDFDFVGVTECFNEDLAQIDSALGHPGLQPFVANTSKKPRPLTSEEIAAIRDFHKEDVALYERALALRAQRMP